jgi:hypothetical protein
MALPNSVLQHWKFTATTAAESVILPDGCRDLIFRSNDMGDRNWIISTLGNTAYKVASAAGEGYLGYRFQPGARVNASGLLAAIGGLTRDYSLSARHWRAQLDQKAV